MSYPHSFIAHTYSVYIYNPGSEGRGWLFVYSVDREESSAVSFSLACFHAKPLLQGAVLFVAGTSVQSGLICWLWRKSRGRHSQPGQITSPSRWVLAKQPSTKRNQYVRLMYSLNHWLTRTGRQNRGFHLLVHRSVWSTLSLLMGCRARNADIFAPQTRPEQVTAQPKLIAFARFSHPDTVITVIDDI